MKNLVERRLIELFVLGFVANVAVMITLLISIQFRPSDITGSALEVHNAISTLAGYSPIFVIGSLTAYLISQTFDVWFFHKIRSYTGESKLWLRNNLSTITSQLLRHNDLSIHLGYGRYGLKDSFFNCCDKIYL